MGAARDWGQINKRLCLSSSFRNLKLKVNKKVSNLNKKSLPVFKISRFLCYLFVLSLWTLYVYFAHGVNCGYVTIALLANSPAQTESLLHSLQRAAAGIGLYVNAYNTEYMCVNQRGDIYTQKGSSQKREDKFTYLRSSVSSTKRDINTRLAKAWRAIDSLLVIWKTDLSDKMKRSFFQAAVVSILLYGCTTWMLTNRMEKNLDGNYTRMLREIWNKSWRQHPTKQQLYGNLPPITKTIQVRRSRHVGHCWRSRDKVLSDVFLWTPSHGRSKTGRPARTDIQLFRADRGYSLED